MSDTKTNLFQNVLAYIRDTSIDTDTDAIFKQISKLNTIEQTPPIKNNPAIYRSNIAYCITLQELTLPILLYLFDNW